MGRITLVCTAHTEDGLCNENELLQILLAVGPDVIFEELRPADFSSFYGDTSKHTLEMRAVTSYLKGRQARQVPVDDYDGIRPGDKGDLVRHYEFVGDRLVLRPPNSTMEITWERIK